MNKRLSSHIATMEIVKKHNFKFTKSLGQNFLIDDNIIDKIIDGAGARKGDKIIEVGPGIGTLTRELAQRADKLMAVEIDRNLIPILKETLAEYDNVTIVNEDIMKADINKLVDEKLDGGPVKLVANLPYYITTPIIMRFLEENVNVTDIVIMVQKEVAERMNATPGNKTFGALSVAVQYYCDTEIIAKVPRHMFVPQPSVDSIVIALRVRPEKKYNVDNEEIFFKTVKAAFGQRRKTLLNSLTSMGVLEKEIVKEVLAEAEIDEKRRGETLSLYEFAHLSNCINRRIEVIKNGK
ncbi:16S rRNA (adenine(1518)-N(6)/adenine(1519)-N(6))-dimethyltransferase RsmA [Peptostreptococcus russellii]|uniref:16S rRNA (adenine(1518)-N(6)/adenine(1519)-N(6))- dimethyltransferase RsmA n=1 Tax=Peptostreptococcus russellii TaxID=215200 RepID=UPI0016231886|nr:16S rRNA (adenine(1518)-N(6)/adenine(1519)-N(6))-dimethyltransferase RsmA [Peptostreptococcus russellii]MBC2578113.1 16S rRNA (adenine(1518)-N(6)/adenine(1519)-N(6))-dimethyltransferase RsmA [Peptostreptococcus russellii]